MVLYSPDWTNTGFSFILLTVNPFRHSTLTEHGLYLQYLSTFIINSRYKPDKTKVRVPDQKPFEEQKPLNGYFGKQ